MEATFCAHRIDHSQAFSWDGAYTNQAESYFSRLRRAVEGQHDHVSHQYPYQYTNEATWREDHCRVANGSQYRRVLDAVRLAGQSSVEGALAAAKLETIFQN